MNFKPTLLKAIISIIVGIILGWFFYILIAVNYFKSGAYYNKYLYFVIVVIVVILITYIIWSLIQKKK
ncbi:hypothetical protein HY212_05210 [Candidatus Pacearchaeota archaeon]|nr:hypothetical protein [Candidatus Pacearchaeota archaeon]